MAIILRILGVTLFIVAFYIVFQFIGWFAIIPFLIVYGIVNLRHNDNVPQVKGVLCESIKQRKCVELEYGGHKRIVEVHVLGRSKKTGNTLLRCFQVSGRSNSDEPRGWKLMYVNKISNCSISDLDSEAPRHEYNPNDPVMTGGIICRI